MKDKTLAIFAVLAVLVIIPIMTSIAGLALAVAAGYILWNREPFMKTWKDVKEVIRGKP